MKILHQTLWIIVILFLNACTTQKIEGLWVIEKVQVGEEEMTPIARWIRLHGDKTQESGNGWLQHSIGTYDFDEQSKQLSFINTNGYDDPNPPFSIILEKEKMQWSREEEGQKVVVSLKRATQLPVSPGNQTLGIWQLKKASEDGKDILAAMNPDGKRYLFLRPDQIFNIRNTPKGRLSGAYRIHGHKNEIELAFFGENCIREYWDFEVTDQTLKLTSVNGEKKIVKEYVRIRQFLN